jgi:excinuclease UvrABC nuclease subunit
MYENATNRTMTEEIFMHDHIHEDRHDHTGPTARQLLHFMQAHNEEHAHELSRLADRLAAEGSAEQAKLLRDGIALIRSGNAKVAEALTSLKTEQEA